METPFDPLKAGLYAALLRRTAAENAEFREWYATGIESLDKAAWGEQFEAGPVIDTLIDLHQRGAAVRVGRPFVDALIDRATNAVAGQFTVGRFEETWQEVLSLLPPDLRRLLARNLYEAAQRSDGNISDTFFEMYGHEIADPDVLAEDGKAFMTLFDPILASRKARGLEWAAGFFEANRKFHDTYRTPETVEAFKDHLRDYFTGETGDDHVDGAVRRIGAILMVEPDQDGLGEEGDVEKSTE